MKTCTVCKVPKELEDFDKKKNGSISGYCKDCRREKIRQHYKDNSRYYKDKAAKRNKIDADKFIEYKKSLSCTDCDISFEKEPFLCDFHHIGKKDFNISEMRGYSFTALMKEVSKCIPLCSNCHRRRHNMPH